MPKFTLSFTTTIDGQVTVEAGSLDEAHVLGGEMAMGTLNYDELTDGGRHAPYVDTVYVDGEEAKS